MIKDHADHGNYAKPPANLIRDDAAGTPEHEPTAEPSTRKRTRRPPKPTA